MPFFVKERPRPSVQVLNQCYMEQKYARRGYKRPSCGPCCNGKASNWGIEEVRVVKVLFKDVCK